MFAQTVYARKGISPGIKVLIFLCINTAVFTESVAQNVGIGVSDPLMKMHVATPDNAVLLLENTQLLNAGVSAAFYFKTGSGSYPFTGAIKTIGTGSTTARLGLFTFASGTPSELIERLSILDNGNVGINTSSPTAKLEVNGTTVAQKAGIGTTEPHANAVLEVKQTNNQGLLIPRGSAATRTALHGNTAKGLMLYDTTTNSLWIHNGNGMASGWTNQQVTVSSAIIPFASGAPVNLTNTVPYERALLGFGSSIGIIGSSPSINLTTGAVNYAFSVPRDGVIKSISAYFSNTQILNLSPVTASITAQLYSSDTPDNSFTAVDGTQVVLSPTYSGTVPIGTVAFANISGLSIPVTVNTRLLMVFSASGDFFNAIPGYASAGVSIE